MSSRRAARPPGFHLDAERLLVREGPIHSWKALFDEFHPQGVPYGGVDRGLGDFLRVAASHLPRLSPGEIEELLDRFHVGAALAENPALTRRQARQMIRWVLSQNETAKKEAREAAARTAEGLVARSGGAAREGQLPRALVDWLLERVEKESLYMGAWYAAVRALLSHPETQEADLLRLLERLSHVKRFDEHRLIVQVLAHPAAGARSQRAVARLCSRAASHADAEMWIALLERPGARQQPEIWRLFLESGSARAWSTFLISLPTEEVRQKPWREMARRQGIRIGFEVARAAGLDFARLVGEEEELWGMVEASPWVELLPLLARSARGEYYRRAIRRLIQRYPAEGLAFLEGHEPGADQQLPPADWAPLLSHADAEVRLRAIALLGRRPQEAPAPPDCPASAPSRGRGRAQ